MPIKTTLRKRIFNLRNRTFCDLARALLLKIIPNQFINFYKWLLLDTNTRQKIFKSWWLLRCSLIKQHLQGFSLNISPTGSAFQLTFFSNQPVFDLTNLNINQPQRTLELRSFPFGESINPEEPAIASIFLEQNKAYIYNEYFLEDIRQFLFSVKNKPKLTIDEPAYLIPYYTNHFGHFTGESLGAIITLSKLVDCDRKIYYVAPDSFDSIIQKYGNISNLKKISSKLANEHNIFFNNAMALPRISPWQNINLCQQLFGNVEHSKGTMYKNIFLTSQRQNRIDNIDEVSMFLEQQGFYVLNPSQHSFEDVIALTRDADNLISENGSITHNILMGRRKTYYVLSSTNSTKLGASQFAGGGIFNALHLLYAKPIFCPVVSDKGSHHPYSNQIIVPLNTLINHLRYINVNS